MKKDLVVIGASGFGRETLDVIEEIICTDNSLRLVGVVDDAPSDVNKARLKARSIPFLGTIDEWFDGSNQSCNFVVGIGAPRVRQAIAKKLEGRGYQSLSLVHPHAQLGSRVKLAEGVVICAGAVISTNVQLERYVHVNPQATIGHDSILEEFVSVNPGAIISGEVQIQTGVLVGAGALVLQQLSVGADSLIGAGAVVTKSVPPKVIVKGVPGRWS